MTFQIVNDVLVDCKISADTTAGPDGLLELQIPEGVTKIGSVAFSRIKQPFRVVLPDSVQEIDAKAFRYCKMLESVHIPASVTKIGREAFSHCESLHHVEFHANVKALPMKMFYFCTKLSLLTLPETVQKIGKEAFCYSGIADIHLPEGLKEIGERAFFRCEHLKTIHLPANVKKIGPEAFRWCIDFSSITVSEESKWLKAQDGILYDKGMKTLIRYPEHHEGTCCILPDTVTEIRPDAFDGANHLQTIQLSEQLTELQEGQFAGLTALENLKIPASVTRMASFVFTNCHRLKNVIIPETVEEITAQTFLGYRGSISFVRDGVRVTLPYLDDWSKMEGERAIRFFYLTNPEKRYQQFMQNTKAGYKLPMAMWMIRTHPEETEYREYLKRFVKKAVQHCVDLQDEAYLLWLLEQGYVTAKHIDDGIQYAIDQKAMQLQMLLLDYKQSHFGFADPAKALKLV